MLTAAGGAEASPAIARLPAMSPVALASRFLVAAVLFASPALARTAAPAPASAVPASLYSGRWYELARTPNLRQHGCEAPSSDFESFDGQSFTVREVCHEGSPQGRARVFVTRATLVPGSHSEKFRMSFVGGLIHQEFWILDHAADGSWAIMATPGGNFAWLLSRRRTAPAPGLDRMVARLHALGYTRLEFPLQ